MQSREAKHYPTLTVIMSVPGRNYEVCGHASTEKLKKRGSEMLFTALSGTELKNSEKKMLQECLMSYYGGFDVLVGPKISRKLA